jgi:transposase
MFFRNHARKLQSEYDVNSVMRLLVYGRILFPGSKKKTFERKDRLFDKSDFSLDDIYRCLTFVNTLKGDLTQHLHKQVTAQYGRASEPVYYDVTNYYFEIDEPDELRRKGVSKEHRPNPIVAMGLLMDNAGLPITYKLFSGNTNDCETLIPLLKEVKREFGMNRLVVVADKGMNTSKNITFNLLHHDGYVYSQTVRGANKELKDFVLKEDGYRAKGEDFKIKSRVYPRIITVTDEDGKKRKVDIDEKQVAFYSRDYDLRAKAEREPALKKAHDLVNNPAKYNQTTAGGAARYVKNLVFDKKTGEVLSARNKLVFDEARRMDEEKYDGYYAIVTSECDKTDEEIVEIYRGLWKIEESFKVTKSDFHSRPVFVSREDHIQAHFLICFLALLIARLLEKRLGGAISIARIAESLNQVNACWIGENQYAFSHADEVTHAIKARLGIDLERRFLSLGEIKKLLGSTKTAVNPQPRRSRGKG